MAIDAALPTQPSDAPDLAGLREQLTGHVWQPGEDRYAELATPWNVAVRTSPLAVAEVADADDVARAVRWAGRSGVPVTVQSTGHGTGWDLAGTLLVHTGRLDECTVHAEGWARVGAGVRWHQVLDAAAPHGLAPLCGSAPHVGVVGYTTGGGIGPAARSFGAASDRVRAFDVVTGDGELRRATATQEPDLFWGLRGGKGTLGVVTAIEFDLVLQPEIYAGALFVDGEHADAVVRRWLAWSLDLPMAASTSLAILNLPPLPSVPEPLAGRCTVAVRFVWTGDPDDGERTFRPMREVAPALIDAVQTIPYAAIGTVHADPVDPMPVRDVAALLGDLPDAAADALLEVAGPGSGSPLVIAELRRLGGALAAEPAVPSALGHRDATYALYAVGIAAPPVGEAVAERQERLVDALRPWATGGAMPTFVVSGSAPFLPWDEATRTRLDELARRYDPAGALRTGLV
ncbi:FAD-binding oxidoreductase [Actinotalea sp. Marseille-Q4924]|uniref:FAD-binding oxidoreductase n=1 Tax=Actinotalea sp. Marseille-Q4924 TaxID=2866571 RepID=UPI001CE42CDD|nr:FAD-binding oxidoreductase [Actinotalea sp. Marseille-Q4924]